MRTYRSKYDTWLLAVMVLANLVAIADIVGLWFAPTPMATKWVVSGVWLGINGLIGWLFVSTVYEVSDTTLTVRSGPFTWVIALGDIVAIYPSRSLLSAPALSLDRIAIERKGSRVPLLISPADRDEFLQDLARRSPGLVKDGSRYRRVGE